MAMASTVLALLAQLFGISLAQRYSPADTAPPKASQA